MLEFYNNAIIYKIVSVDYTNNNIYKCENAQLNDKYFPCIKVT